MAGRKEGTTSSQHGAYVQGNTHTTMDKNSELQARKCKLISEICPQFRLWAATRPHEDGLGSNRGSANRGEYVLSSCTKIAPTGLVFHSVEIGTKKNNFWKRNNILRW